MFGCHRAYLFFKVYLPLAVWYCLLLVKNKLNSSFVDVSCWNSTPIFFKDFIFRGRKIWSCFTPFLPICFACHLFFKSNLLWLLTNNAPTCWSLMKVANVFMFYYLYRYWIKKSFKKSGSIKFPKKFTKYFSTETLCPT